MLVVCHLFNWIHLPMSLPLLPVYFLSVQRLRIHDNIFYDPGSSSPGSCQGNVVSHICSSFHTVGTLCLVMSQSFSFFAPTIHRTFVNIIRTSLRASLCQLLTDTPSRTFATATYSTHPACDTHQIVDLPHVLSCISASLPFLPCLGALT